MRNYAETCKGICSYNLVYNFLIQLLFLQSSVFVVHFSNAFWHGNEAFPKGSSWNEIVPLLIIFHLPYSTYRGRGGGENTFMKICVKFVLLVQHSCNTRVFCVPLVSHLYRSCLTRVSHVALVSHSCCSCRARVARVWHSCCKKDQINICEKQSFFQCSPHVFTVMFILK